MAGRPKLDLGLTGYDELFMTDEERQESKLPRIYDIPIELIDDFPGHPYKVRIDEDKQWFIGAGNAARRFGTWPLRLCGDWTQFGKLWYRLSDEI